LIPNLILKLKEKKTQIIQETMATLKKLNKCLTLDEIFDSLDVLFDDKSGEARSYAIDVIINYLDNFKKF
jgi:hypothetical protein